MNGRLNTLSCLFIGILFFVSFVDTAESGVIVATDSDGNVVKGRINLEYVQAKLDLGELTAVKNILEVSIVGDEQKDVEVRILFDTKTNEAEQAYNLYQESKEKANGDMTLLLEAKGWLKKAIAIWTDNYAFQQEQREIDSVISLVESGCYDIDRVREKSQQEILQLLDEFKACKVDEECEVSSFSCPFGCYSAINKEKTSIIKSRILAHLEKYSGGKCGSICMYDCPIMPDKVRCIDNKCSTQKE